MDTKAGFKVDLPSGWEDQSLYIFKGPDDSGVEHRIILTIDNDVTAPSLKEFAQERIEALLGSIQGAEILNEENKVLAGGDAAREFVIKWVPVDGQIIFRREILVLKGKKGYHFSANFSKKTIKTIGNEVDQILNSFIPEQ
jgi:hypothetical protein